MSAKFTQGEWSVEYDGSIVMNGQIVSGAIGIDGSTQEEKKANSMLISAAPELLAVLERVQSMFSYQFEGGLTGCMADLSIDVHAAIAKATGGAQ